jgi:hypothetical protein
MKFQIEIEANELVAMAEALRVLFSRQQDATAVILHGLLTQSIAPPLTTSQQLVAEQLQETGDDVPPPDTEAYKQPSSRSWSFDEFDQRVRACMSRLSHQGVIPSHKHWDQHRDKELPTLTGVVKRYKCKNRVELAQKLGYLPPHRKGPAAPMSTVMNGSHAPRGQL